jgi:hypothetical protein
MHTTHTDGSNGVTLAEFKRVAIVCGAKHAPSADEFAQTDCNADGTIAESEMLRVMLACVASCPAADREAFMLEVSCELRYSRASIKRR